MTRADLARVTVELSDPRNGATLSTKTLAAASVDEVATRVAGYVARQIFSMDPATPSWCFGAPDGGDLAALLLSRQLRVRVETPADVLRSRYEQIARLKSVAWAGGAPESSGMSWPSSTASRANRPSST